MTFRIFTNDRGAKNGTPKFSCLCDVEAESAAEAVASVNPAFGPPDHAPIKALPWPPSSAGKTWLAYYT